MKISFHIIAISLSGLFLTSCSNQLKYYTHQMQEEFNWNDEELKRIQFYLSEDIVLSRSLGAGDSRVTDGKIRLVDGREIEEIFFKRGTPGVVIFSHQENHFAVSFENEDDRYLMFGPNPKANGRFVLLAKEWERRRGKVSYNGRTYETTSESAYSALMVDIKQARKVSYNSRQVSGRSVE